MGQESASQSVLEESFRYARQVTRNSGSSFRHSFLMLSRDDYQAMCVLYAYMRHTDDLADGPLPEAQPAVLAAAGNSTVVDYRALQLRQWRERLQACLYQGKDLHPLHPALRFVVGKYRLDPLWLEDVITGAEFDLVPRSLATYTELQRYCYLVAGTVGLCCQAIWRADLNQTHQLAVRCGEAFQLTNILRDLHEDALNNRCYLPLQDLERTGCDRTAFRTRQAGTAFTTLMTEQIRRTRECYRQAAALEDHLQGAGRRMFRIMFATYRGLLEKIAADPARVLSSRVTLSRPGKLAIFLLAPHRRLQSKSVLQPSRQPG